VIGVLAAALVAYVAAGRGEATYGADAEILFETTSPASASTGVPRDLATQKVVLASRVVLEPVAKATGIPVDELARSVSVTIEGQSNVLRLRAAFRTRELALRVAQAVARSYLAVAAATFTAEFRAGATRLDAELARLSATLTGIDARVGKLDDVRQRAIARGLFAPVSAEQLRLQAEAQILLQRIGTVQDRISQLALERVNATRATMLSPPHALERQLSPRPLRAAATGILIGLILAVGFVVLFGLPRLRK
jgi:capsular polysaccharide biosynthesis protein